jgi:hypothetical protein
MCIGFTSQERVLNLLGPFWGAQARSLFAAVDAFGVTVPFLGITAHSAGVCHVVTSPAFAQPHAGSVAGDASDLGGLPYPSEVEMQIIPSTHASVPITVSVGGIKTQTYIDKDKKVQGSLALCVSVCIDSRAASMGETKRFCTVLQTYMNSPTLLDKSQKKLSENAM